MNFKPFQTSQLNFKSIQSICHSVFQIIENALLEKKFKEFSFFKYPLKIVLIYIMPQNLKRMSLHNCLRIKAFAVTKRWLKSMTRISKIVFPNHSPSSKTILNKGPVLNGTYHSNFLFQWNKVYEESEYDQDKSKQIFIWRNIMYL